MDVVLEVVHGRKVRVVVSLGNILGDFKQFLLNKPPTQTQGTMLTMADSLHRRELRQLSPQLFSDSVQSHFSARHQLAQLLSHTRM